VLARSDQFRPPEDLTHVDVWLPHSAGMAEMIERIRVLAARKRGPKKVAAPADVFSDRERRIA
jgi:hypothetical protein